MAKKPPDWFGLNLPAGKSGVWYNAQFTQDKRLRVTLFLDGNAIRKVGAERMKELESKMPLIRKRFGGDVILDEADGRTRVQLEAYREGSAAIEETERWDDYIDWIVDALGRWRRLLQPEIAILFEQQQRV
jgi:hypothetical protein